MSAQTEAVIELSRPLDRIALITINRPERLNALNLEVKRGIEDLIRSLDQEKEVRAIILTGAGRAFAAGTDIAEMANLSPVDHNLLKTDGVFQAARDCSKPLIAAVEGFALGGGCELALACDLIVAGRDAKFGQPEIRVGIMPGAGGAQLLLRTIGKYRAMKMVLTGEHVSAEDAFIMGFVSQIVEPGNALETSLQLGATIATMPPLSVMAIKEAMKLGQDMPLSSALQLERKAFQILFASEDQSEGMTAFLQKRDPAYQGR